MSGSNYHVSYGQILETERRLKISSVLKLFSQEPSSKENNLGSFIKSFTPKEDVCDSPIIDLALFLSKLQDISTIIIGCETLQSLTFIAGYCVYQYLKNKKLPQ